MIMRSDQLRSFICTALAVVGLCATSAPVAARCVDNMGNRSLEGQWVITISQPDGGRFVNLVTFTRTGDLEIFASSDTVHRTRLILPDHGWQVRSRHPATRL